MGNNSCWIVSLFVSNVEATWDDILALALCTPSFRFQQCVRSLEACALCITNWCTTHTTHTVHMWWKKPKQIIRSAPTMMHFIETHNTQMLRRPNKIVFPPTKLLSLSKVNSDVSWHVDWRLYLGSRFPYCVLSALSWNTTNENPSTDKWVGQSTSI